MTHMLVHYMVFHEVESDTHVSTLVFQEVESDTHVSTLWYFTR